MNWLGMAGKIADTFNDVAEMNKRLASELVRLNRVVGQQGKITQRASATEMTGGESKRMRSKSFCALSMHSCMR